MPKNDAFFAFKLFTNSIVNSSITFASNEATNSTNKPQLLFYTSKEMNIPIYDIHDTVEVDMTAKGVFDMEVIKDHNEENEINLYGGWTKTESNATGFFRVEKDCDDTWHIIDPIGNMFYSAGLNTVNAGGELQQPESIKSLGINTMGSWSDESISNIAYTPRFNVLKNFKNTSVDIKTTYELDILPVFEPNFKNFCNELAAENLQQYKDDPWVLGYFLDNELPFHKSQLTSSLKLPTNNVQYQAANTWMIIKYGSDYNQTDITEDDEKDYQGYVAKTYFKTVSDAFRAVDPNHMLIGTRIHAAAKYIPQLFEEAGKYMDIISVNYYNRYQPKEEFMNMWLDASNSPFIITEFYVKGNDVGLSNQDGAGWSVATQQDRANWYENWMLKLLRNKGNVGFHWFRFIDKPEDDANKGLFDKDYNLYQALGSSIEKITQSIYKLRSQILYGNF